MEKTKRRFSKKFILSNTIISFVSFYFIVVAFISFYPTNNEEKVISWMILVVAGGIAFVVSVLYSCLMWYYTFYEFTENTIILNKGFIFKNKKIVPYNKIHAIDRKQRLIERVLKITRLSIDSGSTINADSAEVFIIEDNHKIFSLEQEIKNKLASKEEIVKKKEEVKSKTIFDYTFRKKLLYVLLNGFVAVIFLSLLASIMGGIIFLVSKEGIILLVLVMMAFGLIFMFIGLIVSISVNQYNFCVCKEQDYIKISYGLISKINNTIQINKIKAIKIEEGFIKKMFKFCTIKLEVVGFGRNLYSNTNILIPIMKTKDVNKLLEELDLLEFKVEEPLFKSEKKSFKYYLIFKIIVLTIFMLLTFVWFLLFSPNNFLAVFSFCMAVYLTFIIIIILVSLIQIKNQGIYYDNKKIIVYNGALNKTTTIILRKSLIGIEVVTTKCRNKNEIESYVIHYYNNFIKNTEPVHMLKKGLLDDLRKSIKF